MRIAFASEPGTPGVPNLDWAGALSCGTAVVLDGLTESGPTGCRHGTAWYVRELGTRLLAAAADPDRPLVDALARAVSEVATSHGDGCDLTHPGSPCATVAMIRPRPGAAGPVGPAGGPAGSRSSGLRPGPVLEYLVLSDAVLVIDAGDGGDGAGGPAGGGAGEVGYRREPVVVTDRSVDAHLRDLSAAAATAVPAEVIPGAGTAPSGTARPGTAGGETGGSGPADGPTGGNGAGGSGAGGSGAAVGGAVARPDDPRHRFIVAQQRIRNRPDGYWIARSEPDAAAHALTGQVAGVRAALLLTDGAALMASHFDALSWRELVDLGLTGGPWAIIGATRELEDRDRDRTVWPRHKTHDDATAVVWDARPMPTRPTPSR